VRRRISDPEAMVDAPLRQFGTRRLERTAEAARDADVRSREPGRAEAR
jgi:hypothetical protein